MNNGQVFSQKLWQKSRSGLGRKPPFAQPEH